MRCLPRKTRLTSDLVILVKKHYIILIIVSFIACDICHKHSVTFKRKNLAKKNFEKSLPSAQTKSNTGFSPPPAKKNQILVGVNRSVWRHRLFGSSKQWFVFIATRSTNGITNSLQMDCNYDYIYYIYKYTLYRIYMTCLGKMFSKRDHL